MTLHSLRAVANGLRTDHPVPDLPFVDDSHIPVGDPAAIEAIGRHRGTDMWGREDACREGGWAAFTTEPGRHDLGWCVRWHPEHGRSVLLYRDDDTAAVHQEWDGPALLFRAGGYWWDGQSWYRPAQVWDGPGEDYARRPVPAAVTVTAADLPGGDPARGRVLDVSEVDAEAPPPARWADDLALWAARRDGRGLEGCVVRVTAPELAGDQLVGAAGLAEAAGIAASTLRAYIARDEGDVPAPQAVISGRPAWTRPVAEEWAEQRRRSPEAMRAAVAGPDGEPPSGIAELWARHTRMFMAALWDNPARRKRWALRWRTREAVEDLARDLGWQVAAGVQEGRIVPIYDLAATVRHAVMAELAEGMRLDDSEDPDFYGITHQVGRMLGWLISCRPDIAGPHMRQAVGDAERDLGIPRPVTERSLRTAVFLDGKLGDEAARRFLDAALPEEAA